MVVGILKEIKPEEYRVSMTPAGVACLRGHGHPVLVENGAGRGSGFTDAAYAEAGAEIVATAVDIYARAELVLHVKEPQPTEYPLIRPGQMVFTYFHFAASESLTRAMCATGAVAIAYETVTGPDGDLPLLTPMSEIAGRLAAQQAARFLERPQGGRGVLLGGVTGVPPATVLILGGGVVGRNAAQMACGLGAKVLLLDTDPEKLRRLAGQLPANCTPQLSSPEIICELLPQADAVIGAVLRHGARAPKLVTRKMLTTMKPGAVLVDVAIDQGGCFETSHPTTHAAPTFVEQGIVHYAVSNMPGAVPLTATMALTHATLPYVVALADRGWRQGAQLDPGLKKGINIAQGQIVYPGVAEAFALNCTPIDTLLGAPAP